MESKRNQNKLPTYVNYIAMQPFKKCVLLLDNQVHAHNKIKISKKFHNTQIEFLFKMNAKQLFEWKLYRKLEIIRYWEIKVKIEKCLFGWGVL